MKTQINCTSKDIKPLIRKHSKGLKHVHYSIFVRPFLLTQDNRGFEGCALVTVSKKQFIATALHLLEGLEARGAKITISVPSADFESFTF